MSVCTCDVRQPRYDYAYSNAMSAYSIYLSRIEDNTRFDPQCPYHGKDGTMVAMLRAGSKRTEDDRA